MPINIPLGYCTMAFHHSGDALQGEAICTMGLGLIINPSFQDMFDEISTGWATHFLPHMHPSYRYEKLTAFMPGEAGDVVFESLAGNNPGSSAGTALPPNVAILLKKVTGFAGKANRGRMYLPGVTAEALSGSNKALLSSFTLGNLNTAAASFIGSIIDAGAVPYLLHQVGIADPPRQVSDLNPAERLATQRGRLRD